MIPSSSSARRVPRVPKGRTGRYPCIMKMDARERALNAAKRFGDGRVKACWCVV